MSRRLGWTALVAVCAAGVAVALTSAFRAMRVTMDLNGGFCARGGSYEIAPGHECVGAAIGLIFGGIAGLLVFGAVLVLGSYMMARVGPTVVGTGLWAALFGVLGWNFIFPPRRSGTIGALFPGIMFWLMAAGGLAVAVAAWRTKPGAGRRLALQVIAMRSGRLTSSEPATAADASPARGTWATTVVLAAVGGVWVGMRVCDALLPVANR